VQSLKNSRCVQQVGFQMVFFGNVAYDIRLARLKKANLQFC
jgi:hypothetical protein